MGSWRVRVRDALVGVEPKQRLRTSQALLVLTMQLVFAGVQQAEVEMGLIPFNRSWPLSAVAIGSAGLFLALIRSGWNRRLRRDRSLALPQTACAIALLFWSYAITGPARGAILLMIASVIMFGIFSLSSSQIKRLTIATLLALATVMLGACWLNPERYDPRVEIVHLLFAAAIFGMAAVMSARFGNLKRKLEAQGRELGAALMRIQFQAEHDQLTGLPNRRAVFDRIGEAVASAKGFDLPPSVALLDIDHFKRINDELGHAAGDAVLRRFASIARAEVGHTNTISRWGGEEFLLLMPSTAETAVVQVIDRIRQRLREADFDELRPGLRVAFSAGVATCTDPLEFEPAVERADAALYDAKRAGRDRTHIAKAVTNARRLVGHRQDAGTVDVSDPEGDVVRLDTSVDQRP